MIFASAPLKFARVGSKYVTSGAPPDRLLRPAVTAVKTCSVQPPPRMARSVRSTVTTAAPPSPGRQRDSIWPTSRPCTRTTTAPGCARGRDRLEVVAEQDVAVGRHEIDAVHVERRGRRAFRIGLDDVSVDPPGVEGVREVHRQRPDDDCQ